MSIVKLRLDAPPVLMSPFRMRALEGVFSIHVAGGVVGITAKMAILCMRVPLGTVNACVLVALLPPCNNFDRV